MLQNEEIKGTRVYCFPGQFREYSLKNPEVQKMMYKEDDDEEEQSKEEEKDEDGFLSACNELEIIDALELPKVVTDEELAAIDD